MKKILLAVICSLFVFAGSLPAQAQFEKSTFQKVSHAQRAKFKRKYINRINQTGRGLYKDTRLDTISTIRLRARLQAVFGDPTQTIKDLLQQPNFRPGKAIEFEYWFLVDGKYPLLVLDEKGPFGKELVYSGASRYVDLMPQIMRTFGKKLMSVKPAAYQDYYYSADREQWYNVQYKNGKYSTKAIDSPPHMSYHYHH